MKVGDLIWCVHHIYILPKQGIILEIIKDMDTFYVVLIENETYTLSIEEVFIKQSQALRYQADLLRRNKGVSRR